MNIISDTKRTIDENKQVVFFSLNDDVTTYKWHANTSILSGQNLQDYLDSKLNEYLLLIRKREYPGAIYQDSAGNTDLEKFEQWITDGYTNPPDIVIDKVTFTDTHLGTTRVSEVLDRGKISDASLAAIDAATTVSGLAVAIKTILAGT